MNNDKFRKLLKSKTTNVNNDLKEFVKENNIKIEDKQESTQGYMNVIYRNFDFVISKDYTGQTSLFANNKNVGISYKNLKHLDFDNLIDRWIYKANNFVSYKETKTERYLRLSKLRDFSLRVAKRTVKDIENLKKQLETEKRLHKKYMDEVKHFETEMKELMKGTRQNG